MEPLRIFIGYDHRQPVAYHTLCQTILSQSSKPVAFTPLVIQSLPIKRVGLTPFTFSRFLVPYLSGYKGWSLFLDIDIIVLDDIVKLFELVDARYTVMVVKNEKKFEWASVLMFNNEKCQILTPEYIETANGLHTIDWAKEEEVGSLPSEWNHLVGYDKPRDDACLVHYTQGIPAFKETESCEYASIWRDALGATISATSWADLMQHSVHAVNVNDVPMPRFLVDEEKGEVKEEYREKVSELIGIKNASAGRVQKTQTT